MKQKRQNRGSWLLVSAVVFLLILALFSGRLREFAQDNRLRQREALETALNRNMLLCYTLEGRYPETLEELLKKHPLSYDQSLFYIDYRLQGANILPEIAILEIP